MHGITHQDCLAHIVLKINIWVGCIFCKKIDLPPLST